jgi:putative Mg2+ transporter-C (MgtC) family protein
MTDFSIGHWHVVAIRLGVATLVGLALGLEREWRGHDAGMRTHALVALSSAAIMVSALMIAHDQPAGRSSDPLRAVQGLAQAIGFIAGGLIFVRGRDVRNMTTAASLWLSAAIGIAAGAGQVVVVVLAAALGILILSIAKLSERYFSVARRGQAKCLQEDEKSTGLPNRRGAVAADPEKP